MVDEAHRTQEGSLGLDMRAALPNARFIGLTGLRSQRLIGTPGRPSVTRRPGGCPQPLLRRTVDRRCATLPIHVETRLVDFQIDKDALDEAFAELTTARA